MINRSINGTANPETWNFDSLGRLSGDANKLGAFTYTYVGVTNRLNTLTYPGGATANYTGTTDRSEFSYDGLSRLAKIVEKTGSTMISTKKFVWCGTDKCEIRNANDGVTLRMYPQGQYASSTPYFYTRDHLGSVREMVDASGTVLARYDYDSWGRSTTVINTNKPDFNFTGLYRHSKSNLDFATYRAYDPDLGRWLSRDLIGEAGGINLYEYTHNDPINGIDPLGLKTCWKWVHMTHFGDRADDKHGFMGDKLKAGDIAVGNQAATSQNRYPKKSISLGSNGLVIPYGSQVNVYPSNSASFAGTVRDYGAFDIDHPQYGKRDWIDIWDPSKSKRNISSDGWISIELEDCQKCPEGWIGD